MRSTVIAVFLACAALVSQADDPPGSSTANLPTPPQAAPVLKSARIVGWPAGRKPVAPQGFRIEAFARNLDSPRWLLALPNGDVLVAEARTTLSAEARAGIPPELITQLEEATEGTRPSANRISLLRDADRDGIAERREVLLTGLDRPSGMLLKRDRLYVASTDAVWSVPFLVGQLKLSAQPRRLLDLPTGGYDNHWTRTLATDPGEQRLYVGVGSATDVPDERLDAQDPRRAAILSAKWDGSDVRVHASGLRNPVGMAFEPSTGRLWAVVNERDLPGDELVPDYLTSVQTGGFYGWPYSYFGGNVDPRRKGERPDLVARAIVPDQALPAHSGPLGLAFYRLTAFPERYRGGAFIGLHGSWNRSRFAGYSVAFVPFRAGKPAGPAENFLTGFVKDESTREVYGRPAGVAVLRDGSLLVADDAGGVIWRVSAQ